MSKIIVFANQKGGVGKTTSCVNLAASLAQLNRQVLLIDLDPQGNATMGCGINKSNLSLNMNDVLMGRAGLQEILKATKAGFDLAPTNSDLTESEIVLLQKSKKELLLAEILNPYKGQYEFIMIDCPPSLNLLTINALCSANSVIIPVQCEYYALEGLTGLLQTITQLQKSTNPLLKIEGLVRTMFDSRNRLATEVSDQLQQHFTEHLFKTIIPRNVRLAEAPSFGLPAVLYDKVSAGAEAYMQLAHEILAKRASEF